MSRGNGVKERGGGEADERIGKEGRKRVRRQGGQESRRWWNKGKHGARVKVERNGKKIRLNKKKLLGESREVQKKEIDLKNLQ